MARRDLQARWPSEPFTPSGGFSARADRAGWWWGFEDGLGAGAKPRALYCSLCYTFTGLADISVLRPKEVRSRSSSRMKLPH